LEHCFTASVTAHQLAYCHSNCSKWLSLARMQERYAFSSRMLRVYEYTCKRCPQQKPASAGEPENWPSKRCACLCERHITVLTVAGCRLGRSGDGCKETDCRCCHSRVTAISNRHVKSVRSLLCRVFKYTVFITYPHCTLLAIETRPSMFDCNAG